MDTIKVFKEHINNYIFTFCYHFKCQHNMIFQLFGISHMNWDEDLHMIYFTPNL